MDPAAVEAALGLVVGSVEGGITGEGGEGDETQGTCEIWPGSVSVVDGSMLAVEVLPVASAEGLARRAELTGDAPRVREPEVRYTNVEGAVWLRDLGTGGGPTTVGGLSVVVLADHVVALTSRSNDPDREFANDLLALSQQVAASYGLASGQE